MIMIKWLINWLDGFRMSFLIPGLLALAASTAFFCGGYFWPWGWAVGIVLLAFSGKSSSEKKGYRF